jgi:WD40 repeat protein
MNETRDVDGPVPEVDSRATVQQYGNFISSICISEGPDPFIASASWDCTVLIHDLKSLRLLATLHSPSGEIISDVCVCRRMGVCCAVASFSMDGKVRVYDGLKGWEMSHCFDHSSGAALSSVLGAVKLVMLDRFYCISGGVDKIIRVRDLNNPKTIIHSLRGHTGGVKCIDVTERGLIASGSDDNTVKLWDLFNGKFLRSLRGHMLEVNAVAFIKESTWLVSGGEDRVFRVWDTTEGARLRIFKGKRIIEAFLVGNSFMFLPVARIQRAHHNFSGLHIQPGSVPSAGYCRRNRARGLCNNCSRGVAAGYGGFGRVL